MGRQRLCSDEIEEKLAARGLKSRIHRRAYRNRKLSEAQRAANTTRSNVRARVEHVFGDQKNGMGTGIVRTIGIVRARCKIGMTNLVYNMRRFVCLERMTAAAGGTGAPRVGSRELSRSSQHLRNQWRLQAASMKGQGLNDLPRCELERRSSHHKGIFFEVPIYYTKS